MYDPMLSVYLLYSAVTTYGLELAQLGRMPLGPNLDIHGFLEKRFFKPCLEGQDLPKTFLSNLDF
jgi:hypothetical protein